MTSRQLFILLWQQWIIGPFQLPFLTVYLGMANIKGVLEPVPSGLGEISSITSFFNLVFSDNILVHLGLMALFDRNWQTLKTRTTFPSREGRKWSSATSYWTKLAAMKAAPFLHQLWEEEQTPQISLSRSDTIWFK